MRGDKSTIVVDKLDMPKKIVLGENATFAAKLRVNEQPKSVSLLTLEVVKLFKHATFKVRIIIRMEAF